VAATLEKPVRLSRLAIQEAACAETFSEKSQILLSVLAKWLETVAKLPIHTHPSVGLATLQSVTQLHMQLLKEALQSPFNTALSLTAISEVVKVASTLTFRLEESFTREAQRELAEILGELHNSTSLQQQPLSRL